MIRVFSNTHLIFVYLCPESFRGFEQLCAIPACRRGRAVSQIAAKKSQSLTEEDYN